MVILHVVNIRLACRIGDTGVWRYAQLFVGDGEIVNTGYHCSVILHNIKPLPCAWQQPLNANSLLSLHEC